MAKNNPGKSKRLWRLGIVTFLALNLVLGAAAGIASFSPFNPADGAFYQIQRILEEAGVYLHPSVKGKAFQRIDLADRRIRDVLDLSGGDYEGAAYEALERALRDAVQAAALCPQADAGELRPALLELFQNAGKAFRNANALANDRASFQNWIAMVTQMLRLPGLQLTDLAFSGGDPADPARPKATVDALDPARPTATPFKIAPHFVFFQTGSEGAKHLFYPLEGRHAEISCYGCHPGGNYAGTENQCEDCHTQQKPASHFPGACQVCHVPSEWTEIVYQHASLASDTCTDCHLVKKPEPHYPGQCSACHTTTAWLPATFDHTTAGATDCQACHAANRPPNHWNGQCSLCHATGGWTPATFNHNAAGATECQSCHADARPKNHWSGQCSACHSTSAWLPATFNHAAAGATDCQSCHANVRPQNHWGGQCSACHSTSGWLPATFNHSAAGATDCQACHAPPSGHWGGQCSLCHATAAWVPATFNHGAVGATDCQSCHSRPANHWGGQCSACHSNNAWLPASFNHAAAGATDCAGCHMNRRPANHYDGQCSNCHSTSGWTPANFNHSFPTNHGNANGQCSACHPSGSGSWSCFICHNQAKMEEKHLEKGIPDYASRCLDCHWDGRKHDN